MSHVKAGGAVSQTKNMAGKRLGVKRFAGQMVKNGTVLVRQRGTIYHPGKNVKLSKDQSLYAVADGVIAFRHMTGAKRSQFYVDVLVGAKAEVKAVVKAKVKAVEAAPKATKTKAEPKKAVVKKAVAKTAVKKTVKKAK